MAVNLNAGQRRNALAGLVEKGAAYVLALAEVDGKRRAETLSLEEFARLTNCFAQA